MRRLLIGLTVLALAWCGWWLVGAWAIDRGLVQWRTDRINEGWRIEGLTPEISGFPFAWASGFDSVSLNVPADGTRVATDTLNLDIPTYWPFRGKAILPDTPVTVDTLTGIYYLNAPGGQIAAAVRPGLTTTLERFSVIANAWQLNSIQGNLFSADTIDLRVLQDEDARDTYHISLKNDAFTPGDVIRQLIGLPTDWPRSFDTMAAEMQVTVATEPEAQLRALDDIAVDLVWGDVSALVSGGVTIDDQGAPNGTLTLKVKGWRQPYEILKENGTIHPDRHFQTDLMLNGLSNIGGDPETLDLSLIFRDGAMSLGPIPLGPAPRILF